MVSNITKDVIFSKYGDTIIYTPSIKAVWVLLEIIIATLQEIIDLKNVDKKNLEVKH